MGTCHAAVVQASLLYPMTSDNTSKHQSLLLARFYLLIVYEDVSGTFQPMKILIYGIGVIRGCHDIFLSTAALPTN